MKRKLFAVLLVFALAVTLVACGEGEETTMTGMVVSVDGTTISLMEMDSANMGRQDFTGGERPTMPEGMERPEGMEGFQGFGGGFNFENFASDAQTKQIDIGSAHISLEIDGGKATGSLEDIKVGAFVTITMNGKGEVTNVLVSKSSGFRGFE